MQNIYMAPKSGLKKKENSEHKLYPCALLHYVPLPHNKLSFFLDFIQYSSKYECTLSLSLSLYIYTHTHTHTHTHILISLFLST